MRKVFDASRPDGGEAQPAAQFRCAWCHNITPHETLASLGARCVPCYRRYCEEMPPRPAFMADKQKDGPRAWAHALKRREESGERLSPVQRKAWRDALGPEKQADETE